MDRAASQSCFTVRTGVPAAAMQTGAALRGLSGIGRMRPSRPELRPGTSG